jgi:hypothetical protein
MNDRRRNLRHAVREDFEDGTGIRFRPWRWVLAIVGAVVVIALLAWTLGWLTQPLRTSSGVRERVGDADNVLYQYEHFHDLCADVIATDKKIALKAKDIADYDKRFPNGDKREQYQAVSTRDRLQTELTGLQQHRVDTVETYNADSAKSNRALFKDGGLPERLNDDTPTCN